MWFYERKLQHPVKIKTPNPKLAKVIITQFGGPDGELAASLRYLCQRFCMPKKEVAGVLNDIGTEELAHWEMIGTMVKQLTKGVPPEQLLDQGMGGYYADHGYNLYPVNGDGAPFTVTYFQSKGDPVADLMENMTAEQKARATYEHLMQMTDDPDVIEPLKFLRAREIAHFQRFGEALRMLTD